MWTEPRVARRESEGLRVFQTEESCRTIRHVGLGGCAAPRRARSCRSWAANRRRDHWAYWNHVALDISRPGKPVDNAFIEAFNATVRRECLSQHWFIGLEDARRILDAWRVDYNNVRPHSALGDEPPAHFRAGGHTILDRYRFQNSPV